MDVITARQLICPIVLVPSISRLTKSAEWATMTMPLSLGMDLRSFRHQTHMYMSQDQELSSAKNRMNLYSSISCRREINGCGLDLLIAGLNCGKRLSLRRHGRIVRAVCSTSSGHKPQGPAGEFSWYLGCPPPNFTSLLTKIDSNSTSGSKSNNDYFLSYRSQDTGLYQSTQGHIGSQSMSRVSIPHCISGFSSNFSASNPPTIVSWLLLHRPLSKPSDLQFPDSPGCVNLILSMTITAVPRGMPYLSPDINITMWLRRLCSVGFPKSLLRDKFCVSKHSISATETAPIELYRLRMASSQTVRSFSAMTYACRVLIAQQVQNKVGEMDDISGVRGQGLGLGIVNIRISISKMKRMLSWGDGG